VSKNSKARAGRGLEPVKGRAAKAKLPIVLGASLREQAVGQRARFRYDQGIQAFCEFFRANMSINLGISVALILALMLSIELRRYLTREDVALLDRLLEHYFELAFSEDPVADGGGPYFPLRARWECSQLLCGLGDAFPEASRRLHRGTRCLVAWGRLSVVRRAPPMPVRLVRAILAWAVRFNLLSFALIVALQFYALLRPGECWGLQRSAISFVDGIAIVALAGSKSSRRKGNALEHASVRDPLVVKCLRAWIGSSSERTLCPKPPDMRATFDLCLRELGCADQGFRLYSLRRGGATQLFIDNIGHDQLLIRGRWQSFKSARVYLEDGVARLALLRLPDDLPDLTA
jgi:integrase